MTQLGATIKNFISRLQWPAVLLFVALLAQAPHAAAVFIRIAPHGATWEVATSFVGAWVYAVALEGATAYFVWRNKLGWAIAFATFSVAHNVAYYMPEAWTFDLWGATLTVRYVFSAVLISLSLPIAIAAFSHVQADERHKQPTTTGETEKTPLETPARVVLVPTHQNDIADVPGPSYAAQMDARAHALLLAQQDGKSAAEIARIIGKKDSTVRSWLRRAQVNRSVA